MYLPVEEIDDNDFYREKRQKQAEKEKIRLQEECKHKHFVVRCSHCNRVLGSEINHKRI